ncbi:tyrosine-type recombinase/integrase [Allonocardiopsis opalescens]|uniref:Site-specific recombinase XerD n=1 Tax=Allonocardiopsis opalescens TaxID=1144618 RepID=A0A2T0Q9A0_9ACTN|nr:site-specific integrase [Allonocardiopsis opalescens]PRY00434.1 site-specific recombinase XerD [Allonocardiopsis opalescens]
MNSTPPIAPDDEPKPSKKRGGKRANGEGSIFPYRNRYAAYVWITTPTGEKKRKWVYGKTRAETHDRWLKLHQQAKAGPVATSIPTLAQYLTYWLAEVVTPHLAPMTSSNYEMFVRLYISPKLGKKRLDKLTVREVQMWINQLAEECQCCVQGKDAQRSEKNQRCCAIGRCCDTPISTRTVRDAWTTLRNSLNNAIREELITRNAAALVRVPKGRRRKEKPWSVEEARQFLESARAEGDPFYAAYVLILVMGFRRGEALGVQRSSIDWDGWNEPCDDHNKQFCPECLSERSVELRVERQIQRVNGKLLHREVKTESSEAPLPLPDICAAALRLRLAEQDRARKHATEWAAGALDLLFTTRTGRPIEPRNFNRSFEARCRKAGVRRIKVHTTRKTCASLLVALDVHPRVAMQVLRHSQISVTMEVYAEVSSKETRAALRQLGDRLTSPRRESGP